MSDDETEFEIIDGQTGARMSVEQKLQTATSGEEIQRLLTFGNGCKPSGSMRRRWLRAAGVAYDRIRQMREAQARCAPDNSREADDVVVPVEQQNSLAARR